MPAGRMKSPKSPDAVRWCRVGPEQQVRLDADQSWQLQPLHWLRREDRPATDSTEAVPQRPSACLLMGFQRGLALLHRPRRSKTCSAASGRRSLCCLTSA